LVNGVKQELDFTREAANNAAIRRARLHDKGIAFPEVFGELTTRRVLVMAEVTGVPVSDTEALDASGVPREELAVNLLNSFLSQVLQDGVYHADPHPGNILIDPQGTEWFIDYGAVGYLDPVTLEALQQMAFGFSMRDPSLLARSVRRMAGRDGEDIDMASLEFELGVALTEVQGSSFDPRAIQVVIRTLSRHGIGVPRALTVLGRALLTLDGTLRIVDPHFRMGPTAQTRMSEIAVGALADPEQEFFKELARSLPSLRMLPQLGEDIALQARSGRLTLRVDRFSGHDGARVQSWLDSILFATLGVFGLIGSVLLFMAAGMAGNAEYSGYLRIVGAIGLLISIAMQMRVIARILSRRGSDDLV
jgi:ubiquinone biosynthesis protein